MRGLWKGIRISAFCMILCMLSALMTGCAIVIADPDAEADAPVFNPSLTPDTRPRVALTFDDGPNHYDDRTKKVVDELLKYDYTATFFVVGNRVAGGDAVAYAVEHGMEIGIHGYTHDVYYDTCSSEKFEEEMNKTVQAVQKQVPDWEPKLMRPIGGRTSELTDMCPYAVIMWSIDSDDWKHKYNSSDTEESAAAKANAIVENILSNVTDGDIILLHDIYESTYDATVILLKKLNDMGYNVVSVSELLGDDLTAGKEYYRE